MPFVDADKTRIFYRWAGREEGPVLVLSHSLGCACDLWEPQVEALGDRFRLLLYDHRGHGESDRPPGDWALEDFGSDLVALLDSLELEQVHFCGISLGGMVGLWLAQRAPERIGKLVAANTSAFTEDPGLLKSRMDVIRAEGLPAIADDVLERWFSEAFRREHPKLLDHFRTRFLTTPAESYLATSAAICDLDLRAGLAEIVAPILVITGDQDRATPPEWGKAIASGIPGAELLSLEAAHLSNVEASKTFNAEVLKFLE